MPAPKPLPKKLAARLKAAGPGYPYNVNARLTPRHYAVLLAIAEENDCGMSEALRIALERLVPEYFAEDSAVHIAVEVAPDARYVAKHGHPQEQTP